MEFLSEEMEIPIYIEKTSEEDAQSYIERKYQELRQDNKNNPTNTLRYETKLYIESLVKEHVGSKSKKKTVMNTN